jgi:hypothetical protein
MEGIDVKSIVAGMCMAAGAAFVVTTAGPAFAQAQPNQMAVAYQAGRNQLGLLKYCQEQGHAGADVVAIQQKLVGMIPVPADTSGGDTAEAAGRKGSVSIMGINQDLVANAKTQGISVEKACQAMASAVKQAGAALPK